jgi:hypothetical protein
MRRSYLLGLALLLGLGLFRPQASHAQAGRLCFNVPGITNCIEGRFREYWEQNGGLPVFGYPITAATTEQTAEGSFLTQYFERNRFELHPEKARPYDVLLGRLGDDRLKQQGRDWHGFAPVKAQEGCLFFAETGHNICDLQSKIGFRTYWEGHGLQDPALSKYQRSLALFGLPLSEVTTETNAAGDTVLTQWFERARFEFHLDKPPEFRVLLGLLGNETRGNAPTQTPPLPPAPPQPFAECNGIGPAENAIAAPNCVKPGELFAIAVFGFEPDQEISYRLTTEAGAAVGGVQTKRVGVNGFATIDIDTKNYNGAPLPAGNYVLVAQSTGGPSHSARAPFRVLP